MPVKNEAANLRVVLPELPKVHEIVLVDGGSVDGTVETARALEPSIRVIHQTRRGKGNALACGFAAATGDILVMFDGDGSADPAEIPRFVDTLIDGADFAKGSRFAPGGGSHDITPLRRWGNAGLHFVANTAFRTQFSDLCYGYNAFWGDGFEIETVINCRMAGAGVRIAEVPSVERRRMHGDSNLRTFADGTRVLRTIVAERRRHRRLRRLHGALAHAPWPPASPTAQFEDRDGLEATA